MKTVVIVMLFLTFIKTSQAQTHTDIALYNIGLGGIGAGIGAVINKSPEEKTGKVFLDALWRGSLGGGLVYGSKKIVQEIAIQGRLEYSWPAKIINAAGISLIEDAANNRPLGTQWHMNIGFNRIELYTRDSFKVKYKILPISFALTLISAYETTPEWEMMLRTGEIIFSASDEKLPNNNGVAFGNIVRIRKNIPNKFSTISHEFIHIYQYYDYNFTTSFFKKPLNNWSNNSTTFNKINDWIHWDFQAPILRGLYLIEEINISNKFDNFFEFEAEFFSDPDNLRNLGF